MGLSMENRGLHAFLIAQQVGAAIETVAFVLAVLFGADIAALLARIGNKLRKHFKGGQP